MTGAMALALLLVGVVSWRIHLRTPLEVEATSLAELPLQIDLWRGEEIPLRSGIEEMLDADYNLQRTYVHPLGGVVWLYVGYYGTTRGGRPEHTPWLCYPSNGWKIMRRDIVTLRRDERLRASEIVVEKGGERRLVHFWYQSYRRAGMLGGFDQALERLRNQLLEGRADGSLVRLSAPIAGPEEEASARARLISFSREIVPLLRQHWPRERPRSSL